MCFHLFGKKLFIRFTVRFYREHLSVCVCFFGFEGGLLELIVFVPDFLIIAFLFTLTSSTCISKSVNGDSDFCVTFQTLFYVIALSQLRRKKLNK